MSTKIPWADRAGIAGIESEDFTNAALFSGDFDVVTDNAAVDASVVAAVPALTVMEWNAGKTAIQPAVQTSGHAIAGVLGAGFDPTVAGATILRAPFMKSGIFNPDALVWDATFDTDAKKKAFFEASPVLFLRKIGSPAI